MKKILVIIGLILVAIQLIPIDRTNAPVKESENFVSVKNTPESVKTLLKNACYDCHSNETKYPKYAYIAPISWSVKHHINEGREHLNFSVWEQYNPEQKSKIVEETIETIESKEMPFKGYIPFHPEANLSAHDRATLINYFKNLP